MSFGETKPCIGCGVPGCDGKPCYSAAQEQLDTERDMQAPNWPNNKPDYAE